MLHVNTILMDYLTEPVGVEETPRFGWLAEDDQPGAVQTAYQLQIAREASFAAPLWDSGWIMSEESAHVDVPQPVRASFEQLRTAFSDRVRAADARFATDAQNSLAKKA